MACEFGMKILTEARDRAREKSKLEPGKRIDVLLKCDNPKGCPMWFSAGARDGVDLSLGQQGANWPCTETGGRPN